MLGVNDIVRLLGYNESPNYLTEPNQAGTAVFSVFRQLRMIPASKPFRVEGLYVYDTQLSESKKVSQNIALCVATVETPEALRELRQIVWNSGAIPFLLALSDGAAHLYETFSYNKGAKPLIAPEDVLEKLPDLLSAEEIDTGRLWDSKLTQSLYSGSRVDQRLLDNLKSLRALLYKRGVLREVVHKYIGKFIYLRYLGDRGILSNKFLASKNISLNDVFGANVSVRSFENFSKTIEERFNGKLFEIDFNDNPLDDDTLQMLARVFRGKSDLQYRNDGASEQLCMDFMDYRFEYIPVELLSKVYELFLGAEGKASKDGAYYTPEYLAEYVLSDLEAELPFEEGMKALDPSCGSGIFLSLIYRRLIEKELLKTEQHSLTPIRLRELLQKSIFGVEMNPDACQIAAFSLVLTLLHYVDPPELHRFQDFKFPELIGENILCGDFFDDELLAGFAEKSFDWVAGNPPWMQLKGDKGKSGYAGKWMTANAKDCPVADYRLHDAFAWHVQDFVSANGVIGLIMPTSSLFNDKTIKFRKAFFAATKILKFTNLSNVRRVLFSNGRSDGAISPASVWVYSKTDGLDSQRYFKHFSPKTINLPLCASQEMWAITVNESDIQYIRHEEIADGNALRWKVAQWGNQQDIQILSFLKKFIPNDLNDFCVSKGLGPNAICEGPQFKNSSRVQEHCEKAKRAGKEPDKHKHLPEYAKMKWLSMSLFNRHEKHNTMFSLPQTALEKITADDCYLRTRGGWSGLKICNAPHLFIGSSWGNAFVVSEEDFIIPPRQYGLAGNNTNDIPLLKALAVYLSSSLVKYWMFFFNPEMGNYDTKNRVLLGYVKKVPVPEMLTPQIKTHIVLSKNTYLAYSQ